jgi:Galactosyltransferase
MRILVAVLSCHRLDYFVNENTVDYNNVQRYRNLDVEARRASIRDTWVKELVEIPNVDYKFFLGSRPRPPLHKRNGAPVKPFVDRAPGADEIFLPCDDFYTANSVKMKAICRYALSNNYDFLLRTDDDTFVYPDRLLIDHEPDWVFADYSGASAGDFIHGGCMLLSPHAMRMICGAAPKGYADDVWIGEVMKRNQVFPNVLDFVYAKSGDLYKVDPLLINGKGLAALHSVQPEAMKVFYDRRFE